VTGTSARAATVNPFSWDRPIDDPAKIVGMEPFAHEVARIPTRGLIRRLRPRR